MVLSLKYVAPRPGNHGLKMGIPIYDLGSCMCNVGYQQQRIFWFFIINKCIFVLISMRLISRMINYIQLRLSWVLDVSFEAEWFL